MTDYLSRYGLEQNPFLKNSKDIFLDTAESSEVSTRLGFLSDTKGIGILTGEPGQAVLNAANGTPRMINKICNRSLMIGASKNLNSIDADIVMKAVNDIQLG